ncbi:MAG: DciA family protein [Candidatus Limnocylindrales bacterium]
MTDPTERRGRGRPGEPRAADPDEKPRGMERLGDLLSHTARQFGLEEQLEQARAASAWLDVVAERVPAAAGSCRLTELSHGVATIEADAPIVAQEIRLRSPELLAALRASTRAPILQLRITTRHV